MIQLLSTSRCRMPEVKSMHALAPRLSRRASGAYSVEFAIVVVVFLAFVFGIIEIARAMYVVNTLQEATRRAATAVARIDFRDTAALDRARQRAIFRDSAGELVLGHPITDAHLRIDYLALVRGGTGVMTLTPVGAGAMPACPGRNRLTCTADPNDPSCIRFVRVRVCAADDTSQCKQVRYTPTVPLVDLPLDLPRSTTIALAETLGYTPGMTPCP
ncbi:MAG TPA: TadE/TadG family type IV pilus assembly protein [Telluria sp.]